MAVSGQNVAFVIGGVLGLTWLLGVSRVVGHVTALVAVIAYVLAVGWQPSVVRAGVAGGLASLAWLASRPRDRWHFLALGALVLLIWTPTSLLEPGFQLSFVAVGAIFVLVPRLQRAARGYPGPTPISRSRPQPRRASRGVGVLQGFPRLTLRLVEWRDFPRPGVIGLSR
jgi:competence protein ComEC